MNRVLVITQSLLFAAGLVSGACGPSGSDSEASPSESLASVMFKVDGMT